MSGDWVFYTLALVVAVAALFLGFRWERLERARIRELRRAAMGGYYGFLTRSPTSIRELTEVPPSAPPFDGEALWTAIEFERTKNQIRNLPQIEEEGS